MEVQKSEEVSLEDMPDEHKEWCAQMTEIFQRGVAEAKAENRRLGITSGGSTGYASAEEGLTEIPLVSESEPELE